MRDAFAWANEHIVHCTYKLIYLRIVVFCCCCCFRFFVCLLISTSIFQWRPFHWQWQFYISPHSCCILSFHLYLFVDEYICSTTKICTNSVLPLLRQHHYHHYHHRHHHHYQRRQHHHGLFQCGRSTVMVISRLQVCRKSAHTCIKFLKFPVVCVCVFACASICIRHYWTIYAN